MALVAGNEACTTGLSKRIFEFFIDDIRTGFRTPEQLELDPRPAVPEPAMQFARALSYAVARAVVAEIQANASPTIT